MNLIDFFDKCRFWGTNRNRFLSKIYFYSIINKIVIVIANFILPLYFEITKNNPKYSIFCNNGDKNKDRIIVSLTSFHVRVPKLWLVVETILRNRVEPDKIVLYLQLSKIEDIPYKLYRMKDRGVEFVLCDTSLRSHNKYYHAFRSFPNDYIITIDDDMFYRTDFIESLINNHEKYPNMIITNWAKKISIDTPMYKGWGEPNGSEVSVALLPIGVAGVLYPPQSLYKDVLDEKLIKSLSMTADDVWLTAMALLKGTKKYFSGYKQNFLPVLIKNNVTLDTSNVGGNVNQVCVDNINNYYKEKLDIRPFIDLVKEK